MAFFSEMFPKIASKASEYYTQAKKLLIIIGVLLLLMIVGGWIIFYIHGITFISKSVNKNYGPAGVCPYVYSSIGLSGEEKSSIIGALVDTVVGVIYARQGDQTSGLLKDYRNNILANQKFQIIKIILLVLVIALNGAGFAMGFLQMTSGDLLKKMLIVAGFVWATQSGTYTLYDQIIEPLVMQGSKELASFLAGSVMKIINSPEVAAYADRNFDNEFVLLDGVLQIIFSHDVFNKIGALIFTNIVFLFIAPAVYIIGAVLAFYFILFSISIIFYKIVMVVGLSLFPVFVLFGIFKAVSNSFGVASAFFGRYIENTLVKPAISIALLIYGASFLAAIILNYLAGAFSFKACIKNFYTPPAAISFIGNFDYFTAIKPEKYEDLMGTALSFKITDDPGKDIKVPTEVKTAIGTVGVAEAIPTLGASIIVASSAAAVTSMIEGWSNFKVIFPMFFLNMVMIIFLTVIFKKLLKFIEGVVNEMEIGSGIGSGKGSFSEMAESLVSKATGKANQKLTSLAKSWGGKKKEPPPSARPSVDPLRETPPSPDGSKPDSSNPKLEDAMKEQHSESSGGEDKNKTESETNSKTDDQTASDAPDAEALSGQEESSLQPGQRNSASARNIAAASALPGKENSVGSNSGSSQFSSNPNRKGVPGKASSIPGNNASSADISNSSRQVDPVNVSQASSSVSNSIGSAFSAGSSSGNYVSSETSRDINEGFTDNRPSSSIMEENYNSSEAGSQNSQNFESIQTNDAHVNNINTNVSEENFTGSVSKVSSSHPESSDLHTKDINSIKAPQIHESFHQDHHSDGSINKANELSNSSVQKPLDVNTEIPLTHSSIKSDVSNSSHDEVEDKIAELHNTYEKNKAKVKKLHDITEKIEKIKNDKK